jgi:urease accessory protein
MTGGPGDGILEFTRVAGRTALTRARACSPLTLLSPRRRGSDFAWAVCGTLGGGLVAGDEIRLHVHVQPGCRAVLGTQASTKIYRSPGRETCRQELRGRIDADGFLMLAADPVTCFAGAVYEQRQRFDMAASASLVAVDWLTSGRRARGERWRMTRCSFRTEVFVEGRQVFRDALRLDGEGISERMGECDCWASVIVIGKGLAGAAGRILGFVSGEPVVAGRRLYFSAGPISGGALLRVAGASAEHVLEFFRARLPFLAELAGGDPWPGK